MQEAGPREKKKKKCQDDEGWAGSRDPAQRVRPTFARGAPKAFFVFARARREREGEDGCIVCLWCAVEGVQVWVVGYERRYHSPQAALLEKM